MRFSKLALFVLMALWSGRVSALVTFNVNSTEDHPDDIHDGVCADAFGKCTLRAAIMEANLGGSVGYLINLPAGTYTLMRGVTDPDDHSNGDLDVNVNSITIKGAGAAKTIIDANHVDRAFKVSPAGFLELDDLTIRNGKPSSFGGRSTLGGAVYALASVNVARCVLDSNTSSNAGGAISISGSGNTVVVAKTTFSRNSAAFDGGGLYALQSHAFFDSCTFDSNTSGSGGGIAMLLGQLYMLNSTLYQNQALTYGGGMYVASSTASLHNLTLGGNVADSDLDDNGTGGGMYVSSSTMTVMNSVFANLNEGTHGNDDCATSMTTVAFSSGNVFRSIAGCSYTGLVYYADPGLAVLRDNGGPTRTEIPSPSSGLVINGGPAGGCVDWNGFTITVDQRGVKRPIGAACDLGAVEVEPIGDANGDGTVDLADVFYVINFLFAGGPVPLGRANVNGGSVIDVADVFYLINYLFAGGPAPI